MPNPYHAPAGTSKGGQFTSKQLGTITNAAREAAGLNKLSDDQLAAANRLGLPTSYTGEDSTDPQYKNQIVNNPLPKSSVLEYEDIDQVKLKDYETMDIDLSTLTTPQDYINPLAVEELKLKIEDGSIYKVKPIVANIQGENVIINGNHTLLAAKLAGKNTYSVRYYAQTEK
jgi:hypothetical protein